jgi:glycosyltransferase involved in cell wall biosynthesis
MNLLVINLDKRIFLPNSASLERLKEYSRLVDRIFVIVWITKKEKPIIFENKLFVYPTNSWLKFLYFFDTFRIFKKIKKENKIDLLFTQDPFETGLIGWLIAKKHKISIQLQIHTDFLSPYFAQHSMLNRLRVVMAKFLIPRADCLRVVSERIKKSIVSSFKFQVSRITVLPIFVDVEKIKNAPVKTNLHSRYPQFDFIILMASRLTKEKNIGLAIEALHNANNTKSYANDAKIGLVIVGEGPEEEKLKFQVSSFKIQDNIIFEPWADDLISYYKTADLFLLTSNYEGYGMTLVEAVAAGCKIISSGVGIADEILEPENIFRVGDILDLKNKIEKAVRGEIKPCLSPKTISKEEYLRSYKKSWETC